jgi:hypothetical protein
MMRKIKPRILKASDVNLEGRFLLGMSQNQSDSNLSQPQVCIKDNNSEYAVIEITCSCGKQMFLRCDYSDALGLEHSPA